MIKKLLPVLITVSLALTTLFAFDWPQKQINSNIIISSFGQKYGADISFSYVFADPEEIYAIGKGKILIIMTDDPEETTLFPSTLGTSVIIEHDDELLSVYGNLDRESVEESLNDLQGIQSGQFLGRTGNSGWQKKRANLEFQMMDTTNQNAVNPIIFMPRAENQQPLQISRVMLENRKGEIFNIDSTKTFDSGFYKIYKEQNASAPYRSTITINGVILDQITYDTIKEENNRMYVSGKKQYLSEDIYPDDERQLLGEAMLTPGKITLGIELEDYIGNSRHLNYILQVH